MNYWVVKGQPRINPFHQMLRPGKSGTWRTASPPKLWCPGDRLFFWASSPAKCIIGLGELGEIAKSRNVNNDILFDVLYLTHVLDTQPGIEELRANPSIGGASFLKAAVSGTVFPLTSDEGEALYRLVVRKNAQYDVWPDISGAHRRDPVSRIKQGKREVEPTIGPADFDPRELEDAKKRVAACVVIRQGQPKFRRELLKAYGGQCAVTGYNAADALEAAHIIPYLGSASDHVTNGLLLRADIHMLFDLRLISVDTKRMTLVLSPALKKTSYRYLAGKPLLIPDNEALRPSKKALGWHRKEARW